MLEFGKDGPVDKNPLDGNAGLAGIAEPAGYTAVSRSGNVRVVVHDDGGIASQLEQNLLLSRALFNVPADWSTSGEADQLDAFVGDENAGIFI